MRSARARGEHDRARAQEPSRRLDTHGATGDDAHAARRRLHQQPRAADGGRRGERGDEPSALDLPVAREAQGRAHARRDARLKPSRLLGAQALDRELRARLPGEAALDLFHILFREREVERARAV